MQQQRIDEWLRLHKHYQKVKSDYNLLSSDIFKQLSFEYRLTHLEYLSESGINRNPATKLGTVGRATRDILKSGLSKIVWLPSTATYKDKLIELCISNPYIKAHFVNHDKETLRPQINITINIDETSIYTKEQLQYMFTIDNEIPIILEVTCTRYLENMFKPMPGVLPSYC